MVDLKIDLGLSSESDVEQKFIYPLLTKASPEGLAYRDSDFRTKANIKKIAIDKGTSKKLYFPDYAIICDGLPLLIIEAKAPGSDLHEALREARLYASEINASYTRNINPCERVIATDGHNLIASYWDQETPEIELSADDFTSISPKFAELLNFASQSIIRQRANTILRSIRSTARYFKPTHMLGGKSIANETVGDNSFGTNISIEYKYLFNPETAEDRASIINNAYVGSKRKQAHVAPIDRIIRTALPRQVVDAKIIEDSKNPDAIIKSLAHYGRSQSEICLLVGSVGSGKSTFTDYLRISALPGALITTTQWVNLNLNKAPLNRDLIYKWIVDQTINEISKLYTETDFNDLNIIKKIYSKELAIVEKGKASLYPQDSEKYIDIIFNEIDRLQKDSVATLLGIINLLYKSKNKLLIIVLDNCDKRNREDQLLMFEVASWLKSSFPCMVFLPLRDTTYDQYRNEPPLDTVIKDLVFRIDPPLLEKVIYARLNFALREITAQKEKFSYSLLNGMRVECSRDEVARYLKSIISSLFQDQLFKRVISGLAGRNIRRGLEILLDFCKSGHIESDEILKIRTSDGDHKLPNHLISTILLKGKRKYYSDSESNIKNLFSSDDSDSLPDPFVRIAILQWLKNRWREAGPNKVMGFHKSGSLISDLQGAGHTEHRIIKELSILIACGCIFSETQTNEINNNDLISIAPAGQIHLDLLRNINYLSAASEDVLFRENQVAKQISDNIVGRGKYKIKSRQTTISNGSLLINYLSNYHEKFFIGDAKIISSKPEPLFDINNIKDYVDQLADNDGILRNVSKISSEYPNGTEVEGQIVSVQDYGFFVEFGLQGNGLIHKSKFNGFNHETIDSLEAGDWIVIEIIDYNTKHQSFDLKLIGISSENQLQLDPQIEIKPSSA